MAVSPRRSRRSAAAGVARSRNQRGSRRSVLRTALIVPITLALALGGVINAPAAFASSVTSAVFSGTGTVSVGGTLYAKQGTALTLTVVTSNDTKCVAVTGAANAAAPDV